MNNESNIDYSTRILNEFHINFLAYEKRQVNKEIIRQQILCYLYEKQQEISI